MRFKATAAAFTIVTLLVTALLGGASAATDGTGPAWATAVRQLPAGGPGAEAAVAGTFTLADTPGDVAYGSGDITAIKLQHLSNTVRLSLRTKLGSNPARSDSWVNGMTSIIWSIDVNNSGGPDFLVGLFNTDNTVVAEVVRNNQNFTHICDATYTHGEANQFVLQFPRSCISSHPAIRAYATVQYDRYPSNPNAPVSVDYSPNTTWTPLVTR